MSKKPKSIVALEIVEYIHNEMLLNGTRTVSEDYIKSMIKMCRAGLDKPQS